MLKADLKSIKIQHKPSFLLVYFIFCTKRVKFILVPHPGTKPVWFGSNLSERYYFNFDKNLISRNLYNGLRTTIGRNCSGLGILGHSLFNGINLASNVFDMIDIDS